MVNDLWTSCIKIFILVEGTSIGKCYNILKECNADNILIYKIEIHDWIHAFKCFTFYYYIINYENWKYMQSHKPCKLELRDEVLKVPCIMTRINPFLCTNKYCTCMLLSLIIKKWANFIRWIIGLETKFGQGLREF